MKPRVNTALSLLALLTAFASLLACQSPKDLDNVELTDFTKDLISLYVNDVENECRSDGTDEIILISETDSSCFSLFVFSNHTDEYEYCDDTFLGQTNYMGYTVKVHGDENPLFYNVSGNQKKHKRCKPKYIEYDPLVWSVCLNKKDLSIRKRDTYKILQYHDDISDIQNLVASYFPPSQSKDTLSDPNQPGNACN